MTMMQSCNSLATLHQLCNPALFLTQTKHCWCLLRLLDIYQLHPKRSQPPMSLCIGACSGSLTSISCIQSALILQCPSVLVLAQAPRRLSAAPKALSYSNVPPFWCLLRLLDIYQLHPKHSQPPMSLRGQLLWREFFYTGAGLCACWLTGEAPHCLLWGTSVFYCLVHCTR